MTDGQVPYKGSPADVIRQSRGNVIMRGGDAGDLTAEDWTAILVLYQNTCAYCRAPLLLDAPPKHPRKATIDHVVSLTQGGQHTKENVRPSCWRCNSRKGERFIAPLAPPGMPKLSDGQTPLPDAGPLVKKLFTPITDTHKTMIIDLRHTGASISEIMRSTGLTFNQIAHALSQLQKAGKVPIIGRGRRSKADLRARGKEVLSTGWGLPSSLGEKKAIAIEMLRANRPYIEIAQAVSSSTSVIAYLAKMEGLQRRKLRAIGRIYPCT